MAFPSLSFLLILPTLISFLPQSQSQLSFDYYDKTCPKFHAIMENIAHEKQTKNPPTAAGMLRVFFHDCVVGGCDASVLIASTTTNKGERDHDINRDLPGDAFDMVTRAKTALELECPGVVSCADIMAVATRNLITIVGGPRLNFQLGRKDSLTSQAADVSGHIATTKMHLDEVIPLFAAKGFNVQEMVALMGAHTIGFSHCIQFADRLWHFNSTTPTDPAYDPTFADRLKLMCKDYIAKPTLAAFNDALSPGKFDNMYFKNLFRGLGLLKSDHDIVVDNRTRPFVELYAADQKAFFDAFSRVMEKVSVLKIKTGTEGEVRRRCDQFNNDKP